MPNDQQPFVVIKFFPTENDPDETFEVGLRKWLHGKLNDHMCGETYWPPLTNSASQLVKFEQNHDPAWNLFKIEVKRFYDTYLKARAAVPKFIDDSNYETEADIVMGRGMRRKKRRILDMESSDSEEETTSKNKFSIPAPPAINNAKISVKKANTAPSQKKKKDALGKREELMKTLSEARKAAAGKVTSGELSKWSTSKAVSHSGGKKESPMRSASGHSSKAGMTSPWKVTDEERVDSPDPWIPSSTETQAQDKSSPKIVSSQLRNLESPNHLSLPQSSLEGNDTSHRRTLFRDNCVGVEERMAVLEQKLDQAIVDIVSLSTKCDLILLHTGRLLRSVMPNEKRLTLPPLMPALPLSSAEDLHTYEKFLERDDNLAAVCDYMASYVKLSCSDPERKSTHNILSKLVTNSLAKTMNLDGGNNKIAFRSTKLYKVLQGTLQTSFPKSDLSAADDALQKWLKDAKWRKQRPSSPPKKRRDAAGPGAA